MGTCFSKPLKKRNVHYPEEGRLLIDEDITRGQFETYVQHDIEKIEGCVNSTIQNAGLKEADIDIVLLTGGSSFIPIVRQIFEGKLGSKKIHHTDAFTSVSYGLGLNGGTYL